MARVTLLEPYPYGNGVVSMRYGSTEARIVGQPRDGEDDEVIDLTRSQRRIIPGRPIHYHISFEPVLDMKCECQDEPFDIDKTIVMPLPAAMVWFGQWTKFNRVYAPGEPVDTEDTMRWQKNKVAAQWGGYVKRPRTPQNYTPNDWRTLENIGTPAVPNVEIVRLDTQFRAIPNSAFRPREVYNFEADCVADRWTQTGDNRIMQVTESEFEAAVAAAVARALAPKAKAG